MRTSLYRWTATAATVTVVFGAGTAAQVTVHREQLSNGLVLLHTRTGPSPTVAVCGFVRAGAAAEAPLQAGLRQLLVRVLLDQPGAEGARRRAMVADLGARVAADVAPDFVEVSICASAEDLEAVLALLRSLLLEPEFDAETVGRQQAFLLAEVRRRETTLAGLADRAAAAALYPQRTMGLLLTGTEKPSVPSAGDLAEFHRAHFAVNHLVVSVAGAVSRDTLSAAARRRFGGLLPGGTTMRQAPPAPLDGPAALDLPAEGDAALVEVVGRAPAVDDDTAPATAVALAVLGDGMGSRLFQAFREQDGLAYTARTFSVPAAQEARAGVMVTCHKAQADLVSKLVRREVERLQEVLPTEEELRRAAQYLITQYRLAHQGNQGLAHALGAFEVSAREHGYGWDLELPGRLRAVRAGDAREASRRLLAAAVTVRVGVSGLP